MGCCCCGGSRIFDADDAIPGQGRDALETFRNLGLRDSDIDKLFKVFKSFDVKSDNGVEITEFLLKLHLELTKTTAEVFKELDENKDGMLTFEEFVVNVYKYLIKGPEDIASFAFDIFDKDDSGALSEDEIKALILDVYGKKKVDDSVIKMIKSMDRNKDKLISKQEFVKGAKMYPQMLYPAFAMQDVLRQNILGEGFWKDALHRVPQQHRAKLYQHTKTK